MDDERKYNCRKALSKSAKRLVEESLKEALSGCGEEHRKRRVLLTDVSSKNFPFCTTPDPLHACHPSAQLQTFCSHIHIQKLILSSGNLIRLGMQYRRYRGWLPKQFGSTQMLHTDLRPCWPCCLARGLR